MKREPIIPGTTLGKLTLIRNVEKPRFIRKSEAWGEFKCACGTTKHMRIARVAEGYSRSCGCAAKASMNALIHSSVMERIRNRR